VLTEAFGDGTTTTVTGYVQGDPNSVYYVQIFLIHVDSNGNVQGQPFVADLDVYTGDAMLATFAVTFTGGAPGQLLTATATDLANDTSEFSAAVLIADARTRAGALPQSAADASAAAVWSASREHPLAADMLVQTAELPSGNDGPARATVDAFFGGASLSNPTTLLQLTHPELTPLVDSLCPLFTLD
jgi:hypothetical protein